MARPARPWFRFYVEAVHDRKLRRLKPEHRWLFVACLAAARQSPEPGVLLVGADDPMLLEDLVDLAAMPATTVRAGMDALCAAGIVTVRDGTWVVPAWADRQYESDSSRERTAKWRRSDGDCDGGMTPVVTPPETETDTETDREAAQERNSPRGTRIPIPYIVAPDDQEWAEQNHPGIDWDLETKKFVDHFRAKTGKDATKLDWPATWRNWIRRAGEWR